MRAVEVVCMYESRGYTAVGWHAALLAGMHEGLRPLALPGVEEQVLISSGHSTAR
jgi:hypothetical protein